ncbi:MAG: type I-MYXAN CRISPR-associated endonuclease Cas1 [Planctomycetaceae bacterium]
MIAPMLPDTAEPPLRVMSLHALLYCERLFYLEEVEEIRVADANVFAGRRLHVERLPLEDETPELRSFEVSSEAWGLLGKVDAVRRRVGAWVAYEHKRGRCRRGEDNRVEAWPSDRIQAVAYAVLVEEAMGEPVRQARVRYHADNVTALIEIDDAAREDLRNAIKRARELRLSTLRPPVTDNERLCTSCSLAPVCLPEEERLAKQSPMPGELAEEDSDRTLDNISTAAAESNDITEGDTGTATGAAHTKPFRLPVPLPANRERHTLHVVARKAYVSRSAETLVVSADDEKQTVPIAQVDAVVLHGHGQMTTQALHLCASRGIGVQWMTFGGRFVAGTSNSPGRVQQRIRQYAGLSEVGRCLDLARQTVRAKLQGQLQYLLRSTRGQTASRSAAAASIERIRESLRRLDGAATIDTLRGLEGLAAKAYFSAIPLLLSDRVPVELRPDGRTRHPPRDCFNALLSFGYGLLFGLVHRTLLAVGLEPAFGYYHQPRSAAPPLVLDLMEVFRVPLVDMPVVGSLNRGQWNAVQHFTQAGTHVWLSDVGRKQAIALFEDRLAEGYRHPHTGSSLTYTRLVELEARLLEKEWSGAPGLFAQFRIR